MTSARSGPESGAKPTPRLRGTRIAVVMAFVANGVLYGSWASRIPAIKEQAVEWLAARLQATAARALLLEGLELSVSER